MGSIAAYRDGPRRVKRFKANGRQYPDTPAGRLRAAADKANATARLRGHRMMHWSKRTDWDPPAYTARCGNCGAGIITATGRAPRNDPAYPGSRKLVRFGRILSCPGPRRRR